MDTNKLKFAFFGTPDVAEETLSYLIKNDYIPSVIITSMDKHSGRGLEIHESPVSILARKYNITCLKPEKLNEEFLNNFKSYNVDLSIVVAYGKILKEELINTPRYGTINIHYSLLPKYRGASPLQSALLNGDDVTGVCIQQMQFALDSGPILVKEEVGIDINDTKEILKKKLIETGSKLLRNLLPDIISSNLSPTIQDESLATFCTKIRKEDGELDLSDDPRINYNKYRAYDGWPGTYFYIEKNEKKIRIKITKAHYQNEQFVIDKIIPEGKKEMIYEDFMRNNS